MKMLEGKVAVVTGGTRGIGLAIVKAFLAEGASVALFGSKAETVEKALQSLKEENADYPVIGLAPDLGDYAQVEKAMNEVKTHFGKIDILANNAGVSAREPIYDLDSAAFDKVVQLNVNSVYYCTKAVAPIMKAQGGGSIVNFASMNTYCPLTGNFAYAMGKAAVANLTQSFAAYFAEAGVRVNAVAPGFVVNERSRLILGTVEEGLTPRGEAVIAHTPMHAFGKAQDMCGTVRFLLDGRASRFVTGVTIPVDGGFLTLSGV